MNNIYVCLYIAHEIGETTLEVFLITCMGMSLALPFSNDLSLIYTINNKGFRTEPCCPPNAIGF